MHRGMHARVLNVIAAVDRLREQHAELRAPATPRVVWRVLARDGIAVRRGRIRRKGRSSVFQGDAVITLHVDLSPRVAWKWALHEWGHVRLHFPEHGEFERQLSPCSAGDPREDEATLFALLLALGPTATPDTPEVAALVGKMVAREVRRRTPEQLPLSLPERPPAAMPRTLPEPFDSERAYERRLVSRAAKRRALRDTPADRDFERIKYYDARRRTTRFTDVTGRLWWLYNYRAEPGPDGRRRWVRVADFISPDVEVRCFVSAAGERRVYQFRDRREQRAYRVKHLDRQLAESLKLPNRQASLASLLTRTARSPHPK